MPRCPSCSDTEMKTWKDPATGLEIDTCPGCHGYWFDAEELAALFPSQHLFARVLSQEVSQSELPGPAQGERHCPRCGFGLKRTQALAIEVDLCRRCRGIWLDAGELLELVRRYREGRSGDLMVLNQLATGLGRAVPEEALEALRWFMEQS